MKDSLVGLTLIDSKEKIWITSFNQRFIGVFLNDFQWIIFSESLKKSKSGMVTTGTTNLETVTFPTENTFSLLPLGGYPSWLTRPNRHLSSFTNRISTFTTSSVNITNTRHRVFLVTIPLWTLSWFSEFSESHLGKPQLKLMKSVTNSRILNPWILDWRYTYFLKSSRWVWVAFSGSSASWLWPLSMKRLALADLGLIRV